MLFLLHTTWSFLLCYGLLVHLVAGTFWTFFYLILLIKMTWQSDPNHQNKKTDYVSKTERRKREVRKKSLVLIYYHLWRLTVRVTKTFTAARLLLGERVSWHFWMNSHINNGSVVKHKYTSAKKSGWQKKKELIDVSRNRGDNSKKISNTLVPTCYGSGMGLLIRDLRRKSFLMFAHYC